MGLVGLCRGKNVPPDEELHADLLRRVDEVLPLCDLSLSCGVRRINFRVPEVGVLRSVGP